MCFASCSQYEHGWFTAYRSLAEDWPDLVLHLGNYQYEYPAGQYVAPGGNVRDHVGPLTATLAVAKWVVSGDVIRDLSQIHVPKLGGVWGWCLDAQGGGV
jgi:hypothetical protein